jgi:hypothetical protein
VKSWVPVLLSATALSGALGLGVAVGLLLAGRSPPVEPLGAVALERPRQEVRREIVELRRDLDIVTGRLHGVEEEVYGHPVSWGEASALGTPDDHEFRDGIRRAQSRCRGGWDLVEIDCSEPPCVALLRGEALGEDTVRSALEECDALRLGNLMFSSEVVDCLGSEPVAYHYLWFGEVPEGVFHQNSRRRLTARQVDLLESNACRSR